MTGWRKRQVLELALEALETAGIEGNCVYGATEIIRKALAQPEQKPMHPEARKMWEDHFDKCFRDDQFDKCFRAQPPQRTWVGLTYEDMVGLQKDLYDAKGESVLPTTFAMAVEAKLKEKNFDKK